MGYGIWRFVFGGRGSFCQTGRLADWQIRGNGGDGLGWLQSGDGSLGVGPHGLLRGTTPVARLLATSEGRGFVGAEGGVYGIWDMGYGIWLLGGFHDRGRTSRWRNDLLLHRAFDTRRRRGFKISNGALRVVPKHVIFECRVFKRKIGNKAVQFVGQDIHGS